MIIQRSFPLICLTADITHKSSILVSGFEMRFEVAFSCEGFIAYCTRNTISPICMFLPHVTVKADDTGIFPSAFGTDVASTMVFFNEKLDGGHKPVI